MVDIQPTTTQPISDDQELAKVLAGVSQQPDTGLQFEETPASIPAPVPAPEPVASAPAPVASTPAPQSSPAPSSSPAVKSPADKLPARKVLYFKFDAALVL